MSGILGRLLTVMCISLAALAVAACSEEDQASEQPDSSGEGEVLFEDDFSDPVSGWAISGTGDAIREYEDGGYRITPSEPRSAPSPTVPAPPPWPPPYSFAPGGEDFEDVSVEVDVSAMNGPDDFPFGVACRAQDEQNHYTLYISKSGNYGIRKFKNGKEVRLVYYSMQPSAIQGGESVNRIRADCIRDTMTLYVNGDDLLQLRDDEFGSGGVGLGTGVATLNRPGADVLFDNFVVRRPGHTAAASSSGTPEVPPPEGEVINEDDFSDPASGWDSASEDFGRVEYTAGALQLSGTPSIRIGATHLGVFADASVEADATVLKGSKNSNMSIICRANFEKDAEYLHYSFYVAGDGTAGIGRRTNAAFEHLARARNVGLTDPNLGETIRLRADCVGQKLTLSINGEKLLEAEDDAISAAGEVGVEAVSGTRDQPIVAQFDNFVLKEP